MVQEQFGIINTQTQPLTNIDLVDYSEGQNVVSLYGMNAKTTYILTRVGSYSDDIYSAFTNTNATFALSFNRAQVLEGNCNISWFFRHGSGSTETVTTNFTIDISHWDGTTDTVIGTDSIDPVAYAASNSWVVVSKALNIALTRTKFKKSDTLRVKFTATTSGSNKSCQLAHDPQNRDFFSSESILRVDMPFRISD